MAKRQRSNAVLPRYSRLRRIMPMMAFLLSVQPSPATVSSMQAEPFTAVSKDGTRIHGQVDMPTGPSLGTVLLVAGTGAFDRDVYLGRSGTERDLVFLSLSKALTSAGLKVARYDKRGTLCDSSKISAFAGKRAPVGWWNPGGKCDDLIGRAQVSATSAADDLAAVAETVLKRQAQPEPLLIFAHSEGMLHVGLAIQKKLVAPHGIVGVGALLESPASVFRWQRVERIPQSMRQLDVDKDGRVTNDEVERGFWRTPAAVFGDINLFLNPTGAFEKTDLEKLSEYWLNYYEQERASALSHADDDPFMVGTKPIASYAWWKTWFEDNEAVASRIKNFEGSLAFFYGGLDSQTPPDRQEKALKDIGLHDRSISLRFPELGHTLGPDVFMGPMDGVAEQKIVQYILSVVSPSLEGSSNDD